MITEMTECGESEQADSELPVKIAPSILSADFTRLGEQVRDAERAGADWIHVDVMDGHFVPNITVGPLVVEAVRRVTCLPLDVHLMIERPERYIETFVNAGADSITLQHEACVHLHRCVQITRDLGARTAVAINPATPIAVLQEILPFLDMVLIMTVNPGFGGQKLIETMVAKIRRMHEMIDSLHCDCLLEVDGGVNPDTAPELVGAGADVLVAGHAVFDGEGGIAAAVTHLRASIPGRVKAQASGEGRASSSGTCACVCEGTPASSC